MTSSTAASWCWPASSTRMPGRAERQAAAPSRIRDRQRVSPGESLSSLLIRTVLVPDPGDPVVQRLEAGPQHVAQRRVVAAGAFRPGLSDKPPAARGPGGPGADGEQRRLGTAAAAFWERCRAEHVGALPVAEDAPDRDDPHSVPDRVLLPPRPAHAR